MNGLRGVIAGGLGVGWLALFVFFFYLAGWEVAQDEVWFPFEVDLSAAEGSFWGTELDAPAGKYGFVRAGPDGNFVFDDGRPVRFWGVGLGSQLSAPPRAVAERLAKELAGLGFNLVRISYLDEVIFPEGDNTRRFDPEKLDRFDYLVSQLKAKGIYIDLVLTGFRRFREGDEVVDWDAAVFQSNYEGQRLLRSMAFVDPRLNQLQKEYIQQLLSHRNPYTNRAYTDEPAIAMLEIFNETSLTYDWLRGFLEEESPDKIKITSYYSRLLDVLWNLWLVRRYGSREALARAWEPSVPGRKGLLPDEDLSTRSVRRIAYAKRTSYSSARLRDQLRFYLELERDFYDQTATFLKDTLKVKVPISGTHAYHGMANQWAQTNMDFLGGHTQWQHPIIRRGQPWSQPPIRFFNTPMVKGEPAQVPYKADWIETRNTLARLAFGMSQLGKPFVISEYNEPFPNEYQAEFPMLMGAYMSLQNWDALVIHHYAHGVGDLSQRKIHDVFMIHNNPIILVQMPLASRVFRKGLIQPAQGELPIFYSFEQILQATERCGMDINCLYEERALIPETVLIKKTGNVFDDGESVTDLPQLQNHKRVFSSETGELTWDFNQGLVTINAPSIQGAIGFVGGKTIRLKNVTLQVQSDFAVIVLVALDDQPLADSQKLALVAVSRVKNEGIQIGRDVVGFRILEDWGQAPVLVQDVRGWIALKSNLAGQLKVFSLDGQGRPAAPLETTEERGTITFQIGGSATLWYGLCSTCALPFSPPTAEGES